MKKKIEALLVAVLAAALLLCGCQSVGTYTQEDIGEEPEVVDESTILGRWYFEGGEDTYIEFAEDGTYITYNEGDLGNGSYTLKDDCYTVHLKENTSGIDSDVSVKYGDDILYFIWGTGREQIFTRDIIEE